MNVSREGSGTTCTVLLPVSDVPAAPRTPKPSGGAYVHFLRQLLEPHGIAVLDAWHPATRAAAR